MLGNCTSENATLDTGIVWSSVLIYMYIVLILCVPNTDFKTSNKNSDKQLILDKILIESAYLLHLVGGITISKIYSCWRLWINIVNSSIYDSRLRYLNGILIDILNKLNIDTYFFKKSFDNSMGYSRSTKLLILFRCYN